MGFNRNFIRSICPEILRRSKLGTKDRFFSDSTGRDAGPLVFFSRKKLEIAPFQEGRRKSSILAWVCLERVGYLFLGGVKGGPEENPHFGVWPQLGLDR